MEYVAFLLFGLGGLLVLWGLTQSQNNRSNGPAHPPKQAAQPPPSINRAPIERPTKSPEILYQQEEPVPQYTQKEMPRVTVKVAHNNPVLIEKTASLYHDLNRRNIYSGEEPDFKLQDISGIRRMGSGMLSYDGFGFRFAYKGAEQKYVISELEHIAFYPNCIVLMPVSNLPAALLFVDETESLRRVLETFRVDSGK